MTDIDAQQELAFIKKVMADSRQIIIDDGKGFILWGILVAFGLFFTYMGNIERWEFSFGWFWLAIIAIGWIVTFIIEIRAEKKRSTRTFAGKIMGALWIGCGVAMTILGFIGSITDAYSSIFINPIIAVVLGIGYLVSGVLQGKTWVSLLCLGWWAGAILMFYLHNLETLLIMVGMMILLQTIPGIILYRESKKELAVVE
ncbi:MAG: hypothetical protein KJO12_10340 [Ignavibacteria bacterium]|nr:hypothetical protein [Ignavibacteria bacterium]